MIHESRIQPLNDLAINNNDFVLYWMQASQRAEYNPALEYSIQKANELNKSLLVFFGITSSYPEANERHYYFMLEGLKEVKTALKDKRIRLVIQKISPEVGAVELGKFASLIVVDKGYTKIERMWTKYVAENVRCPFIQVESNVIVPVKVASTKEEYSAATFRPKIKKVMNRFFVPLKQNILEKDSFRLDFPSFDITNVKKAIEQLEIDKSINKVKNFVGGFSEAKKHLQKFIESKLDRYSEERNDPTKNCVSNMSPYLHFGQISPLYIALKILESNSPGVDSYLEELIIRRELAINFVFYNTYYDAFESLNDWQKKTLNEHRIDKREYNYTIKEFENAQTHDVFWNAAQKEMVITGKMHGYMRMYWGKKIIEWTKSPEEAYKLALYLNNKYELDGRDPNGYAGVAWCFGKRDRPWKEREIFGKIRYMNAKGLKRKFDIDKYVQMVQNL
ncbi:MAG: deoxyribodipyrimidine photo-lyase [Candidatus Bathyarchaeota archaeon]